MEPPLAVFSSLIPGPLSKPGIFLLQTLYNSLELCMAPNSTVILLSNATRVSRHPLLGSSVLQVTPYPHFRPLQTCMHLLHTPIVSAFQVGRSISPWTPSSGHCHIRSAAWTLLWLLLLLPPPHTLRPHLHAAALSQAMCHLQSQLNNATQ